MAGKDCATTSCGTKVGGAVVVLMWSRRKTSEASSRGASVEEKGKTDSSKMTCRETMIRCKAR